MAPRACLEDAGVVGEVGALHGGVVGSRVGEEREGRGEEVDGPEGRGVSD